jgi:hypothetical protein
MKINDGNVRQELLLYDMTPCNLADDSEKHIAAIFREERFRYCEGNAASILWVETY